MAPTPSKSVSHDTAPKAAPQVPLIDLILASLEDAKAEETIAIDITGKSSLSDHMVVTSGRSNRQAAHRGPALGGLGSGRCFRRDRAYLPARSPRVL